MVSITATTGGLVDMGFKGSHRPWSVDTHTALPKFVTVNSEVLSSYLRGLHSVRGTGDMFLKPLCVQSCTVLVDEKLSPLSWYCMDKALLVKTAEKPANRILIMLFRL